jgi:hypothetical protein
MRRGGNKRSDSGAASVRALRSVLRETGGQAKLRDVYQVLSAVETAGFLGLKLQTVRNLTSRHELPCIRNRKHAIGYRLIDLIGWQEKRLQPTSD